MENKLSIRSARIHIITIGIIYLISGLWECLLIMEHESNTFSALIVRRQYLTLLGLVTIVIGVGLITKKNVFRIFAIILAWWNLFTMPIIDFLWSIYTILVIKISNVNSWLSFWVWTAAIWIIIIGVHIYIIYMLRISKAGFIFLKDK